MRSFSTFLAFVTLVVSYGIGGADAGGVAHDKLNIRASIHRRVTSRNVKAIVPPTLAKKSQQKFCRPRLSTATNSPGASSPGPTGSPNTNPPNSNPPNSNTPIGNSEWRLDHSHQGSNFFDGWNFINVPDYTHGVVNYQSREGARDMGLAYVDQQGRARMNVDTTPVVNGNRGSVRIEDGYRFNGNTLVIMDATHMPIGCAAWPAFWSNQGAGWPVGGEIDIVEGVHNQVENLSSLHTTEGCSVSNDGSFSGSLAHQDCTSNQGSNNGCGIVNKQPNNYGKGFNDNGGGVYAMKWDGSGIAIHFFPRNQIPADITNNAPLPETWPQPYANFPSYSCSGDHFFDHTAIFDTTLCGDWAGNAWGECAASTGYASCPDYVANNGGAFADAYWEVNYVKYFVK